MIEGIGLGVGLLSLAIWVPIAAGVLILLTGGDKNADGQRTLALLGSVLGFLVTLRRVRLLWLY